MTKEQERAELHRAIWKIANELRGSVDGWDFKSYVLGMLFYRFISEDITQYANHLVCEAEHEGQKGHKGNSAVPVVIATSSAPIAPNSPFAPKN